jgi:hypothetical protein
LAMSRPDNFRANQLTGVMLYFASKDYGRLAAIFLERYAPATAKKSDLLTWSGEKTIILIRRHTDDFTTGGASITTKAELQESKRLQKEETKDAGHDASRPENRRNCIRKIAAKSNVVQGS